MPNIDGNRLLAGDLSQLFKPGGQGEYHRFAHRDSNRGSAELRVQIIPRTRSGNSGR
jgi:hypothetical protein